jgi:putative ABC transport system permease protein
MILLLRLIRESYLFAFQAIIVNKLRTLLSLLGITIGIFSVITVFTIVDSMELNIRQNIASLGDNVLFIQKWPWAFGGDYPWWKYVNRPTPRFSEMQEIEKRLYGAQAISYMIGTSKTVKYRDKSMDNGEILCISKDHDKTMTVNIADGRFFSAAESEGGKAVAIIGNDIAENFYEGQDPIGKQIKVFGRNIEVIGVLKKKGDDLLGGSDDKEVLLPIAYMRNVIDINAEIYDPLIVVKAKPGVSNAQLRDEITGVMRSIRRLKPGAEDNFAVNETSLITKGFDNLFRILNFVGWFIGGFSLLVGMFGIANIMFVSVRERTHIIGIQKSLGAKRYFILLEFLFEAIFLTLIGGIVGLLIVYLGTLLGSSALHMDLSLTSGNIILGLTVSFIIGILAGAIPAWRASRLDPVVAIRASGD